MLLLLVFRFYRNSVDAAHLACRLEADRTAIAVRSSEVAWVIASYLRFMRISCVKHCGQPLRWTPEPTLHDLRLSRSVASGARKPKAWLESTRKTVARMPVSNRLADG